MYEHLKIYIAGPECFYPDGTARLTAMRKIAEAYGFSTSLPNDNERPPWSKNPRENADNIFKNCADSMNETDIIIADLEFFRGAESDGGTIYEIGMAYAKGCKCYAYTRDKRNTVYKNQSAELNPEDGKVYDAEGRILPEATFPFNLMITGSCKIIEGTFEDALKVCVLDLEQENKMLASRDTCVDNTTKITWPLGDKPRAYLAGPECFDADEDAQAKKMKELCIKYGIEPVYHRDPTPGVDQDYKAKNTWDFQYHIFDRNQQHVRNCDVIIANLNDFHGYEPDPGTAWECGMAYQLGHKMYGFMDSLAPMIERVPCVEKDGKYVDKVGNTVENFDYPLNLMFSSSMKLFEGKFEDIIKQVAIDLGTYTE